jgi:hypothetical protein
VGFCAYAEGQTNQHHHLEYDRLTNQSAVAHPMASAYQELTHYRPARYYPDLMYQEQLVDSPWPDVLRVVAVAYLGVWATDAQNAHRQCHH